MSTIIVKCVCFVVWFVVHLDADVYRDRPKIKSNDGHLIIKPATDKNIYLQTNGPQSNIFVGGINMLNINMTDFGGGGQYQPPNIGLENYLNGPDGILRRLEKLENRRDAQSSGGLLNTTLLRRRVNRLTTRVANLQNLVNNIVRDQCQSRPCLHGGTCLNLATGYHCLCPSNWEGKDCDEDVNECRIYQGTDLGCQNAASCKNTPGAYECQCKSGWYGIHCTKRSKDCSGGNFEMCGHGTCIPTNTGDGIKCICDQGWTTNGTEVACLTDVNECVSTQGPRCSINPKVECINLPGSFSCGQCPTGYEGDGYSCSDIDECITIPNGGCSTSPWVTCHNTVGSRICGSCPGGYQGDGITCTWRGSCSINRGGCHPSAQCIDNPAIVGQMAHCVCPSGMEGDGIGLHGCYIPTGNFTRGCDSNPCGVHGQCHPLRSGYTCICYRGYGGVHCDAGREYCTNNPCLNGGSCRPDESSLRGFRCECTAQYSGDLCHVAAKTCGGYLQAEEGSIVYPLSNTSYNHNARCAWVIHTDRDKVINVTFSKFNLEVNPECLYDFLQIHDGRSSASQIIGRFCGNEFPKGGNIISSHNNLYFWFRSDQTVAKEGFALHWSSVDPVCGGEIDAKTNGHISSPGSPGKYPPNRDCFWHLTTTLGKRIQVHFFSLDIEAHSNCSYDFVAIYDGEHSTDPLIGQYCNSTHPAPVTSAGSDMLIHFHSDGYSSGYGFQIAYAPAEGVPGCGGLYTTEKGEISSPSYNGLYLSNVICEYKIKTNPDTKIRIEFKSFNLESSFRCKYDYVKVYDGPSEDSPLVGRFCGVAFPKSYTSTTNQIYIKFKSDYSVSAEGFRITYETVCQITVIGDSGIIKSPGYPFSYPANRVCEYLIGTSPGKVIQLTFQDFDIEDNNYYHCQYDNVEIRDGININATSLGKFCGGAQHTPPTQTSTHNYMYLRFSSDMSISGTGFYANFTTVDVECGGIYRETTGIINHPSADQDNYSNDQHCVWMLIAPAGMFIKLTWNRFNIESMPSCRSDYVMLNEVDENNESSDLGKYCGTSLPSAITTTTNILKITFQSDSSVHSGGFSVSYAFLDEKTHCGGSYAKVHGFIYSPGWPKQYQSNRDCIWTITAPAGRQILLNITQFNLERQIQDTCIYGDYLEIRNGALDSSPLVGKFCGNFQSKRITSMSNVIFLHFHSDSYLTGNGFKVEWDSTVSGCGGTLSSPSGSISSPNYPQNYNENAECFYRIVTSAGSKVRVSFTELDLERTVNCKDDYVEIFDGRDENGPSLGKYCYMNNKLKAIESKENYIFIKFRSDFYIGGKGFLLEYITVCQNNLTGMYGVIESPGYPDIYSTNLNCLWTITVPTGNRINITFTNFDLSRTFSRLLLGTEIIINQRNKWVLQTICEVNYIQVKEIADVEFGEKMCGEKLPARMSTKSNSLQIKLVTGAFNIRHGHGIRMEWARYGCGGYIRKTYGSIQIDSSLTARGKLECDWVIETTPGTSVTISILDLYMTASVNCTSDAIEFYNGQSIDTPLLTKICHHDTSGIPTVVSSTNFMFVRFVKQSSLKDVIFTAQFDSFRSGCGGRVETLSGVIHSKNFPKNYDNGLNCLWTLVVPRNHRIELRFMDFDLYSSNDEDTSCNDYINIYDGSFVLESNYSTQICPHTSITPIISKNNILGVQFISDSYGTAKGFKANFTVICGAMITAQFDGIIANEKWHSSNILDNCTWTIMAPSLDQKLTLTITHISIPKKNYIITSNRKCPSSFLRIHDGNDANAPLVDEYCGRKVPPTMISKGSAFTIVFGAYNGTAQGQFSIHYSPMTTACGGTFTSEEGSIASPNYPQSYPVNASCEWLLSTSPGNRVYITFEEFDLEWSENCNEDYLEVRENNGGGHLLGVYCGRDIPTNTTSASQLYLKFHSNSASSGRGFVLHYGFLHGNEISGLGRGEITSPLYPHYYEGAAEYSWRISTEGPNVISLVIDSSEIPTYGSTCYNSLTLYDGYDEEAPELEVLCGFLKNVREVKTSSNIAFIKLKMDESNSGSKFHINWVSTDTSIDSDDLSNSPNCGSNETEVLSPGQKITIQSPGYPDQYENKLYCKWVFQASSGHHVNLHFQSLKLEETPNCFADSVSVYSSYTPTLWRPIKEHICLSEDVKTDLNSSNYMKIEFKTDWSITREGFEAEVSSACGGFMSELSGTIEPKYEDFSSRGISQKCDWTVKVRPGRLIKLNFEHFNITNRENECTVYVIIRNGDSVEAPMLASGKYCGLEHEQKNDIESTSNVVFVTFTNAFYINMRTFTNFRLRYEEKGVECGSTSKLDADHKWEVLSSPNYPLVPTSYSECIWLFSAPPGEILRIDFLGRFDLDHRDDCSLEYVEIRDGSSEISPLLGRYCREAPGTVKSSQNTVYIKYSTQLSEPRNGFKANVSIDICGGTITASRISQGEVSSPGYPRLQVIPYGTVCEWRIIGPRRFTLFIKPQDIQLPDSESPCGNKITIEETEPFNNTKSLLYNYCSDNNNNNLDLLPIQTSSNEATIKLHLGRPNSWSPSSTVRGFRFTFNSSRPSCGGEITTPEGFLTTPGYPHETTTRYCQWRITIPDKTRRVRIELLDSDKDKHRIGIYNDLSFQTALVVLPSEGASDTTNVYESSGNTLAVYLWMDSLASRHRFKAKFSSEDLALCGGTLSDLQGKLMSPNLDRSYSCIWQYKPKLLTNITTLNTLFISAKVNSSATRSVCSFTDPKLTIKSVNRYGLFFTRQLCTNVDTSFRIPSNEMEVKATKNRASSLYFEVNWKLNPCGGVVNVGPNEINLLNVPSDYNDTLDCAWLVIVPAETRVQIKLEGSFTLNCDNEFVKIGQGFDDRVPVIGDYCKDKMQDQPLLTPYTFMFIQYHSDLKASTKIKLLTKTITDHCGEVLTDYQHFFESPHYPQNYDPNIECTWKITTNIGNRISLHFIERFAIEDRTNCTKDAVIIYDWKEDTWVQMGRVCGRLLPPAFNSTNNRMKVVLRTDATTQLDGFKAQWDPICGGRYYATDQEKIVYSPGSSDMYLPDMDCTYEILGGDNKISLKFLEFMLEGSYPNCEFDNLTVSAFSDYNYLDSTYCGSEAPPALHEYNKVTLTFKTDMYIQRKGFKIAYQIYNCGGRITKPSVISTNGDSESYSDNENCTWIIEAPKEKIVVIRFQNIDLEGSEDCINDYVAVFNGKEIDESKRIALMCGKINSPTHLQSISNTMLVQFITDSSVNLKGFKAEIFFSYSSAVGCGGKIDLTLTSSSATQILKSPLINGSVVYEHFLDCQWTVNAPADYTIKIKFKQFHVAPCDGVNQTAVGFSKCDCDYVEIMDGINPNDLVMGTYCGHSLPEGEELISSSNLMSVKLHTDGEITSRGFEAELSLQRHICGQTMFTVSNSIQNIKSPGYNTGSIPRALHCIYNFAAAKYNTLNLTITSLDIRPGQPDPNQCNKDKLIILTVSEIKNTSLGHDFILYNEDKYEFNRYFEYEEELRYSDRYEYCGTKTNIDLYLTGSVSIHLLTSAESDYKNHKGFEIEVSYAGFCGRNYSDLHGRISSFRNEEMPNYTKDCFTLITVPVNYTISLYFIRVSLAYWDEDENVYLDIYDGPETSSKKLLRVKTEHDDNIPLFSTGRHMLLHNYFDTGSHLTYDLNYVATDKGRGCGGKIHNLLGRVTSPLYPGVYRQRSSCEWELETPVSTHLRLRFTVFDLGRACDTNYVQLVDRSGRTISTYCAESPADYTSTDNYVKIVFTTNMNNGGTGWVAEFVAVL